MSHFTVLVQMDEEFYPDNIEEAMENTLASFSEHIVMEPYECDCYCKGQKAIRESNDQAQLEWKLESKRDEFREAHAQIDRFSKEYDVLWDEFIKPYMQLQERILQNHPMKDLPDPQCETCNGSGRDTSTYNPNSKWDWWVIGGRWDGDLETFSRINDKNIAYGEELANEYTPFAIVIIDRKGKPRWNERGRMGWFAAVSNKNDNWDAIASELLTQFKDKIFVLVDCHI